jgi:hypothetical protein
MTGIDTDGVTCVGCGVSFERDHYQGNYCADCRPTWGREATDE